MWKAVFYHSEISINTKISKDSEYMILGVSILVAKFAIKFLFSEHKNLSLDSGISGMYQIQKQSHVCYNGSVNTSCLPKL